MGDIMTDIVDQPRDQCTGMGSICRYHITMLVTNEEEDAIRLFYKEKKWTCLLHVLSDETVTDIFRSGFTDIFPALVACQVEIDSKPIGFRLVKSKVVSVDIGENEAEVPADNISTEGTDVSKDEETNVAGEKDIVSDTYTAAETDTASAEETNTASESDVNNESKLQEPRNVVQHDGRNINSTCSAYKKYSQKYVNQKGLQKCEFCGNFYLGRRALRRHYYLKHRDLMPSPSCPVCNEEFETRDHLYEHKRKLGHNTSIWMLKNYQCDTCGKRLTRYDAFRNHKRYVCGIGEAEDQKLRIHPCDVCGKMFKSAQDARNHRERVHFKVEKICDICGKLCLDRKALQCHRKRHDQNNKKHICKDCGKTFFTSCNLQQHVRSHTKEKPYKCPLCNYTCSYVGNVTKHTVNVHKEKLPAVDLRKSKGNTETL